MTPEKIENIINRITDETRNKLRDNQSTIIAHNWMQHLSNNIIFEIWKTYYQEKTA